nr:HAD-IA family hydrolase [uncultured Agathobaculum sp.]
MRLKAVLFDLDDTLYTSFQEGDAYGYEQLAAWAEAELHVSGEAFAESFRQSRRHLARQQPGMPPIHDRVLFAQRALERMGLNAIRYARQAHRIYWEAVFAKMELRPGVTALLDEVRLAGINTAVCTDMLADIQMEKLERLGLAGRIDYLVSSEEAGMDKPAAPVFWLALQKCGCLPNEAVMVGDNFRHDVQGAMDAGMRGVWLNWTRLPAPADDRTYFEAHTFEQAADYIRTLL